MSQIIVGEGKHRVFFDKVIVDNDLILIVGGGETSHVGGVVICEPDQPLQMLALTGHKDITVLQPLAIAACRKYKRRVTVLGGIHIDNASKDDITAIINNCKQLEEYV